MSDYTNKELLEAIYEVRDRVTRIEEKLNRAEKLEDKIEEAYDKAMEAKEKADLAHAIASSNKESINGIKTATRWAWGFIITGVIATAGEVVANHLGIK